MSVSWNVKNPLIFDELADTLYQTVDWVDEMRQEGTKSANDAIRYCDEAIEKTKRELDKLEAEIIKLEADCRSLYRNHLPATFLMAELNKKRTEHRIRKDNLSRLHSLHNNMMDSFYSYSRVFDATAESYKDDVEKNRQLLSQFRELLNQSRAN